MAECSEAREQHTLSEAPANYSVESEVASVEAVPPGYRRTEVGVIPEDWDIVSVKEIGSVRTGPFGTTLKAAEYSGNDGVPLISVGEIREGYLLVSDATPLVPKAVTHRLPQYVLKMGDIVFGRKGGVERSAHIGGNENGWFLGSDGILLRPSAQACSNYLAWQFSSSRVQSWLLQNAIGTTMASLNQSILQHAKIPLAPTETEQRAIAAALSDAEALIEAFRRLIAKKRAMKQAAMQQLLTGRTRLPGFTSEWETKRLGDHVNFLKTGTNSRSELSSNGCVAYLHYGDIHGGARVTLTPNAVSVPHIAASKVRHLDKLAPGDLVFVDASEDLEGVGKSVEIANVPEGGMVAGLHSIAARFDKDVLADGFKAYLQFCPQFIGTLRRLAAGTKVLATNKQHIASVEMALPGVSEQQAIATALSGMDAEIEALERRRDKANQIKQGMMQQLLTGRVRLLEPNTKKAAVC